MPGLLLPALLISAAAAAEPVFDLSGRFSPESRGAVSLYKVSSPFTLSAASDDGRFSFKTLEPGAYTIGIFVPGRGEARKTIEIGPGTADSRGRVDVSWELKDDDFVTAGAFRGLHTIDARQLAVPAKAVREYETAQKDLARRDVDAARKRLERAVEIAPRFSRAWNNLGTIAYQTRNFTRAEECFRRALEADPASYEPLVNLGGVLVNLHKLDEAWKYNAYAVAARPNDALANSQLAMTYFEQGDLALAEKRFQEAVRLDPAHFSHPQLFLAEIHLRRGDRKAAAADLESFLQHHPDWPQAARMRETIAEFRR